MASRKDDDSATLVDMRGNIVKKFSYEELRRLIAATDTDGELNSFVRALSLFNLSLTQGMDLHISALRQSGCNLSSAALAPNNPTT